MLLLDLRQISDGDFARLDAGKFPGNDLFADRRDMVDEKVPVQMGHLMLDHPAGELVESLGHLLEVLVEVLDGDAFRPDDVAIDVRC